MFSEFHLKRIAGLAPETTTEFGQAEIVQKKLEQLVKEVILPNQDFDILIELADLV